MALKKWPFRVELIGRALINDNTVVMVGLDEAKIAVLGIELGKNSCSVVGLDTSGQVILRRRLHRDSVAKLASRLPACVIAMEACCGAHHLGHVLQAWGHDIRLMSSEYVHVCQSREERRAGRRSDC